MAQSVEINGLSKLQRDLQELIQEIPERRRELHERLSEQMQKELVGAIGSLTKTSSGDLASWQERTVGSRGGYAAVRPMKGKEGKYAYGYITNAVESGRVIRKPTVQRKGYRARVKARYVLGLGFYKRTRLKLEKMAIDEANRMIEEIAKALE